MIPVWASTERKDTPVGKTAFITRVAARCNNCLNISSAVAASYDFRQAVQPDSRLVDATSILDNPHLEKTWQPKSATSPNFSDVPKNVAQAAKEAHEAASIGAHIAAILMARTVIEATAKSHGIVEGRLWQKIDGLKDAQLIRPSAAEAAHEIRHLGNDMAHGDLTDLPTEQDAADVLTLMDMILNEVFQATALTAAIKARRTAQKEG